MISENVFENRKNENYPNIHEMLKEIRSWIFQHTFMAQSIDDLVQPKQIDLLIAEAINDPAGSKVLMNFLETLLQRTEIQVLDRVFWIIEKYYTIATPKLIDSLFAKITAEQSIQPLELTVRGITIVGKAKKSVTISTKLMEWYASLLLSASTSSDSVANSSDWKRLAIIKAVGELESGKSSDSPESVEVSTKNFLLSCFTDTSFIRVTIVKAAWKVLKAIGANPKESVESIIECFLANRPYALTLPACFNKDLQNKLSKAFPFISVFQNIASLYKNTLQMKQIIDKMITRIPLIPPSEYILIYQVYSSKQLENEISYLMFRAFYDEKYPSIKRVFLHVLTEFFFQLPNQFIAEMMRFLLFYQNDLPLVTDANRYVKSFLSKDIYQIPPCSLQVVFKNIHHHANEYYYKYNFPDLPKAVINSYLLSKEKQYPYNMLVANIQYEIYRKLSFYYLQENVDWLKVTPKRLVESYYAINRHDKELMMNTLLRSLPLNHESTEEVFSLLLLRLSNVYESVCQPGAFIVIEESLVLTQLQGLNMFLNILNLNEEQTLRYVGLLFKSLQYMIEAKENLNFHYFFIADVFSRIDYQISHPDREMYFTTNFPESLYYLQNYFQKLNDSKTISLFIRFLLKFSAKADKSVLSETLISVFPFRLGQNSNNHYLNLITIFTIDERVALIPKLFRSGITLENFQTLFVDCFYSKLVGHTNSYSPLPFLSSSTANESEVNRISNCAEKLRQLLSKLPAEIWNQHYNSFLKQAIEQQNYLEHFLYLQYRSTTVIASTVFLLKEKPEENPRKAPLKQRDVIKIINFRKILRILQEESKKSMKRIGIFACVFPVIGSYLQEEKEDRRQSQLSELEHQFTSLEKSLTAILSTSLLSNLEVWINFKLFSDSSFNYELLLELIALIEISDIRVKTIDRLLPMLKWQRPIRRDYNPYLRHVFVYVKILATCSPVTHGAITLLHELMGPVTSKTYADSTDEEGNVLKIQILCEVIKRYPRYLPTLREYLFNEPKGKTTSQGEEHHNHKLSIYSQWIQSIVLSSKHIRSLRYGSDHYEIQDREEYLQQVHELFFAFFQSETIQRFFYRKITFEEYNLPKIQLFPITAASLKGDTHGRVVRVVKDKENANETELSFAYKEEQVVDLSIDQDFSIVYAAIRSIFPSPLSVIEEEQSETLAENGSSSFPVQSNQSNDGRNSAYSSFISFLLQEKEPTSLTVTHHQPPRDRLQAVRNNLLSFGYKHQSAIQRVVTIISEISPLILLSPQCEEPFFNYLLTIDQNYFSFFTKPNYLQQLNYSLITFGEDVIALFELLWSVSFVGIEGTSQAKIDLFERFLKRFFDLLLKEYLIQVRVMKTTIDQKDGEAMMIIDREKTEDGQIRLVQVLLALSHQSAEKSIIPSISKHIVQEIFYGQFFITKFVNAPLSSLQCLELFHFLVKVDDYRFTGRKQFYNLPDEESSWMEALSDPDAGTKQPFGSLYNEDLAELNDLLGFTGKNQSEATVQLLTLLIKEQFNDFSSKDKEIRRIEFFMNEILYFLFFQKNQEIKPDARMTLIDSLFEGYLNENEVEEKERKSRVNANAQNGEQPQLYDWVLEKLIEAILFEQKKSDKTDSTDPDESSLMIPPDTHGSPLLAKYSSIHKKIINFFLDPAIQLFEKSIAESSSQVVLLKGEDLTRNDPLFIYLQQRFSSLKQIKQTV